MIKRVLIVLAIVGAALTSSGASADPEAMILQVLPGGRLCTQVVFDQVSQTVCIPTP